MTQSAKRRDHGVPYLDLARENAPLAEELMAAVARIAEANAYVLGSAVSGFEAALAEYVGVRHAVGVASGTDALYLALRLLDPAPDDEIITSPFSFFASAGAIANAGARPVFADIEPRTFNLDPKAVAGALSERTRAIIPVHLFGQMAAMGPLMELSNARGLMVVEDAAQAIGARARMGNAWAAAGSVGDVGCFSFYPTKNLGGWGDGGLVTTDDDELADRLRRLRVHGETYERGRYVHDEIGTNSRLDAIQAAVLATKLRHLPGWTERRRVRASLYDEMLADVSGIETPPAEHDRFHVYNLYTVRAQHRDELRDHLAARDIGCGIYYPRPLHLQPCFADLGYSEGDFPQAERACGEVLSLPIFPGLTTAEGERVANAIRQFYGA